MEEKVYSTFNKYINGNILMIGNGQEVEVSSFTMLFNDGLVDCTYESMTAIDGGNLGFMDFFNLCKADGVLS